MFWLLFLCKDDIEYTTEPNSMLAVIRTDGLSLFNLLCLQLAVPFYKLVW